MKIITRAWLLLGCLTWLAMPVLADYRNNTPAQAFIEKMVLEHDFDRLRLETLFSKVEKQERILELIARPAEKTKSWADYRKIFIQNKRITDGVKFWQDNKEALARAEQTYGVPAEYIVAIIGVETLYGRVTGSYRVMDALSTLAFDYPPRSPFFTKELENYLLLMREHDKDPLLNKGSYAGAMGYGQFMPSSYRHYAVDFDGDNWPDIWNNTTDAIGSVANYFKQHGWQRGAFVTVRARPSAEVGELPSPIATPEYDVNHWRKAGFTPVQEVPADANAVVIRLDGALGDEYWLSFTNFYVITRYNRSAMYAMAVHQLAQAIYREADIAQGDH
ncbi:lytic murein transglycosylase B [Gilvimarinus chinensis]|uniref:lytic murein transglycosylase B n=1 Tax=Gilvimarinus chinensis TaxID=396005 RepID=UPI00035C827F|nr:lytic murein transglycosylase B [Gilvimarinus chinensis]